ncbi:MAG: hypothetical protein U0Z44_18305 [Kouleothrix sp.]
MLRLLADGLSNKEIAGQNSCWPKSTVKNHVDDPRSCTRCRSHPGSPRCPRAEADLALTTPAAYCVALPASCWPTRSGRKLYTGLIPG